MNANWLVVVTFTTLIVYLLHKYLTKPFDYWKKRGIPYVKNPIPYFGNVFSVLTLQRSFNEFCENIYKTHDDRSMIGFFQFDEPNLMIRDPELVKTVLISGFANFHVNVLEVDASSDPLAARNPFFTDGEQWKNERSHLSVVFMSAKKLKILFAAVKNVCAKFSNHIEETMKTCSGRFEIETKHLFSCFTGEVVASAGFGVEGDFFSHGRGPNSFRQAVAGAFDPTLTNNIRQTIVFAFPLLNKFLNLGFVPKRTGDFLTRVVREMIRMRQTENIRRNDFLQIMMDQQKTRGGDQLDEFGITASAASFFFDGYETSAITLSFLAHQLATNDNAQEKLRDEVRTVMMKHGDELTYEALNEMTYMEKAINESMRLHPALGFLVKRCNDGCKLVGEDGLECDVEPGTVVVVPVRGLQNDPKYWRDPEIFNPERFNDDDKSERPKMVFLPFGEGPRMCVGMRFAMMQMKAAVATLLMNWRIELSSRTRMPIEFKATPVLSAVEGGLWINLIPL